MPILNPNLKSLAGAASPPRSGRGKSRPGRRFHRSTLLWLAGLLLILVFTGPPLATVSAETRIRQTTEYDLKAAFLFNFSHFVDWPPEVFFDDAAPFVIGVLGDDPFGNSLEEIVAGETVRGRKIVVKRYRNVEEITVCHILFISQSEHARLGRIFKALHDRPILTVGETEAFSENGGMVRFDLVQSKLHIKINVAATKLAKLTISSKLLRQAEIIDAKNN